MAIMALTHGLGSQIRASSLECIKYGQRDVIHAQGYARTYMLISSFYDTIIKLYYIIFILFIDLLGQILNIQI